MLGKGAFSEVWHCRVTGCESPVAVKVLQENMDANQCREVTLLKDVVHPNLVQLVDVVAGKPSALILELCLGDTISQFLYDNPSQAIACHSMEQRMKPGFEVGCAVAYLHSLDIMHRDIKATNVFFAEKITGQELPPAKLGDLGLARKLGGHMTQCVGTLAYMAPENLSSPDYGKPADVFSTAVLANELAVCQSPYEQHEASRKNVAQMTLLILQGARPQACEDPRLKDLILMTFNADPAVRPSATDFARTLQERLCMTSAGYA
jgi:serine/threonine protein kinase